MAARTLLSSSVNCSMQWRRVGMLVCPRSMRLRNCIHANLARQTVRLHDMLVSREGRVLHLPATACYACLDSSVARLCPPCRAGSLSLLVSLSCETLPAGTALMVVGCWMSRALLLMWSPTAAMGLRRSTPPWSRWAAWTTWADALWLPGRGLRQTSCRTAHCRVRFRLRPGSWRKPLPLT